MYQCKAVMLLSSLKSAGLVMCTLVNLSMLHSVYTLIKLSIKKIDFPEMIITKIFSYSEYLLLERTNRPAHTNYNYYCNYCIQLKAKYTSFCYLSTQLQVQRITLKAFLCKKCSIVTKGCKRKLKSVIDLYKLHYLICAMQFSKGKKVK